MKVIGILGEVAARNLRNISKVILLARGNEICVTELLGFLIRLARELTGYYIIANAVFSHKIEGNGSKLSARTALKEEHLIIVGNIHYLTKKPLGITYYLFVNGRAV